MAFLNRKKLADKGAQDRQRVLNYKNFFGSPSGKDVLFDLMNRYYVLNPIPNGASEFERGKYEGQRTVVLHILAQSNVDMVQFDKILNGEFNE